MIYIGHMKPILKPYLEKLGKMRLKKSTRIFLMFHSKIFFWIVMIVIKLLVRVVPELILYYAGDG